MRILYVMFCTSKVVELSSYTKQLEFNNSNEPSWSQALSRDIWKEYCSIMRQMSCMIQEHSTAEVY